MSKLNLPLKVRILSPVIRSMRPAWLAARFKNLLGVSRLPIEAQEGTFYIDPISHLGNTLIQDGVYEPGTGQLLRQFLRPGGIFVDVGANEGYFSVVGAKLVGPTGRVLAVEPQTRLQSVLHENFRLNQLNNVQLVQSAISDSARTAQFHLSPDLNSGSSGLARATNYHVPTQEVHTTTLAQLLKDARIERVDLMKMDIEGFEYEAILGSPDLLRSGAIRAIALELHHQAIKNRGLAPENIIELLKSCGYRQDLVSGYFVFAI